MKKSSISRRNFLGTAAAAGAVGIVVPALITSCSTKKRKSVILPVLPDAAPDGPLLKAGLIGCGGRGTGAALNFLHAGPNLTITSLGDVFVRQGRLLAGSVWQRTVWR